jgi:hypothetical protein
VLKTSRDYADMVEWIALRPTRKALKTNARGVLPNLAWAIVLEALRRPLRERRPYKEIAEILRRATGCFVTENTIKDIRRVRDRIPSQCVVHLSAADIAFARVYGSNSIAIGQLRAAIVPGSVAESQFFEIWKKRLAASVVVIGGRAIAVASSDDRGVRRAEPQSAAVLSGGSVMRKPRVAPRSGNVIDITGTLAVRITMRGTANVSRALSPLDQARIDKWIRDRLTDWRGGTCWVCRKNFNPGQKMTAIAKERRGRDAFSCRVPRAVAG